MSCRTTNYDILNWQPRRKVNWTMTEGKIRSRLEKMERGAECLSPSWTEVYTSAGEALTELKLTPKRGHIFGWYITPTDTCLIVPLGESCAKAYVWNDTKALNALRFLISMPVVAEAKEGV
jgi:hypothetical protein